MRFNQWTVARCGPVWSSVVQCGRDNEIKGERRRGLHLALTRQRYREVIINTIGLSPRRGRVWMDIIYKCKIFYFHIKDFFEHKIFS